MILETPRLRLRGWRDDDFDGWAAMNADPRVMEHFPRTYDRALSDEQAARMREALERDGYGWWVVEIKDDPGFAGVISLQDVPYEAHFTPATEVGWRFPYERWGHGYATEGARRAIEHAFTALGRNEVVAMTAAGNVRSRRVMERLGMTYDPADDFDHPRVQPGHRLRRHVLYRLLRPS